MRAENESSLDLVIHVISYDKSAENTNRLVFQLTNSSGKNFSFDSTPRMVDKAIPCNSDLHDDYAAHRLTERIRLWTAGPGNSPIDNRAVEA
jgi:hypothetical protein